MAPEPGVFSKRALRPIPTGLYHPARRWPTKSAYAGWMPERVSTPKELHPSRAYRPAIAIRTAAAAPLVAALASCLGGTRSGKAGFNSVGVESFYCVFPQGSAFRATLTCCNPLGIGSMARLENRLASLLSRISGRHWPSAAASRGGLLKMRPMAGACGRIHREPCWSRNCTTFRRARAMMEPWGLTPGAVQSRLASLTRRLSRP